MKFLLFKGLLVKEKKEKTTKQTLKLKKKNKNPDYMSEAASQQY